MVSPIAVFFVPVMAGIVLGLSFGLVYNEQNYSHNEYNTGLYNNNQMISDPTVTPLDIQLLPQHAKPQKEIMLYESSLMANGSPVLGDPTADITIIEWGDYQCTYCYLFHNTTLNQIKTTYIDNGKVRMIFKDFALNGEDSVLAAAASHCAGAQSRYWEYHDILYANWGGERTGWVTQDALYAFANTIGLDISEFEKCTVANTYVQAVDDAYTSGQLIGIDATPSFIIFNDTHAIKIRGNQPLEVFLDAIDRLRADI